MDDLVEDWLLRYAIRREFHARERVADFPGGYERLAGAAAAGERLSGVLATEVAALEQAALEEARAANPGAEVYGWARAQTPVEDLHQLADVVDVLIELDEVTREEAEQFFRHRAERLRTRHETTPGDAAAARRHLEAVWPSLAWVSQRDVPAALRGVGLFSDDEVEQWEARMRPWSDEDDEVGEVGRVLDRLPGPPGRRCGVRVLCLERCESGAVAHLHLGRSPRHEDGRWHELRDEVIGDHAKAWPGFPELRLEDDLGTAYRGGLAADNNASARDPSLDAEHAVHFTPAIPATAQQVWLVSSDPAIRFRLQ